ncbi:type II toxin-antitoxin system RelE/ParE family toxin [Selenomonas ruminantium]|uniref:type II toxin-antitoxin system RelE/ParE family toxin n=1 Tax=Selenomonas ruminantium TaxID=971 RepID=UPI001E4B4130|nr:type II toxin-antitoxin system RelE/ParE family toxin [Selenomonas ruminantium]
MFNIEYFKTENNEKPIADFLLSLDTKMRIKVLRNIQHLKLNGYRLREPLSAPLRDGIFELRTQTGGNITRVLYFFYVNNTIVLTHGFIKKTPKTPPKEIERAIEYRKLYLARKENDKNG